MFSPDPASRIAHSSISHFQDSQGIANGASHRHNGLRAYLGTRHGRSQTMLGAAAQRAARR